MPTVVECPGCGKRYRLPSARKTEYDCKACGETIAVPEADGELSPEMERSMKAYVDDAVSDIAHKLACPHCGEETFTRADKMSLGPARSIACSGCGGKVSVPWSAAFVSMAIIIVPALIVGFLVLQTDNKALKFVPLLAMAAMFPVMLKYWRKHSQLVKR